MDWADCRMTVNEIKSHPFFHGAEWSTIRQIVPPWVPKLRSIADTSHFPTDELGDVSNYLERAEPMTAEKDLAFLGYVRSVTWFIVLKAALVSLSRGSRVAPIPRADW